jgi:integrase
MASLEQRGNRYRVAFRLGGQKYQIAVKAKDSKEAEACLARLEENLRLVERGRLTIPDGADVGLFLLSDGKLEQRVKTAKVLTVSELVATYKATFTVGVKEKNTARTENVHLRHAERILGSSTPISQVSSASIQAYIHARIATLYKGRSINPQTIKKEVATLKFVWNWAFRNNHVGSKFPGLVLVFPKAKLKEPFRTLDQIQLITDRGGLTKTQVRELWDGLYLNPAEIMEVLEHVRQRGLYSWLYPFIATTAHTGARRSELLRARVDDFDFTNRVVILREKKRSKERETFRSVELTPFLEQVMREYFSSTHPGGIYAFAEGPNRSVPDGMNMKAFRLVMQGSKWSMLRGYHTFRHSFVSVLAAAGVDQRLIDEMSGHQTDEMRRRYRHLTPQVKRAALISAFGDMA